MLSNDSSPAKEIRRGVPVHASISRSPFGSGMASPNSLAVSIHNWTASLAWAAGSWDTKKWIPPALSGTGMTAWAMQPGSSGTSSGMDSAWYDGTQHWRVTMETKQQILKAIEELPDNAGVEEALDRLYLLYKIERGLRQTDRGDLLTQEEVRERVSKWAK